MGISAALLNSAVPAEEQRAIMRDARKGKYRLLYLSPERLAVETTVAWLQNVPISLFCNRAKRIAFRNGDMSSARNTG